MFPASVLKGPNRSTLILLQAIDFQKEKLEFNTLPPAWREYIRVALGSRKIYNVFAPRVSLTAIKPPTLEEEEEQEEDERRQDQVSNYFSDPTSNTSEKQQQEGEENNNNNKENKKEKKKQYLRLGMIGEDDVSLDHNPFLRTYAPVHYQRFLCDPPGAPNFYDDFPPSKLFSHFPFLHELTIRQMSAWKKFSGEFVENISSLTLLKYLRINEALDLEFLTKLCVSLKKSRSQIEELRFLRLENDVTDFKWISPIAKSLRILTVGIALNLSSFAGLEDCELLSKIVFSRTKLDEAGIEMLPQILHLQEISLSNASVLTSTGFERFGECHFLSSISLTNATGFNPTAASCLVNLQDTLTSLTLTGCSQVNDEVCKTFSHLSYLRSLSLNRCPSITEVGVAALITSLKFLTKLEFSQSSAVNFPALLLASATENETEVSSSSSSSSSSPSVPQQQHLAPLEELNLSQTGITNKGLTNLANAYSSLGTLKVLLLRNASGFSSLQSISKISSLQELDLFACKKCAEVKEIASLASLKNLRLLGMGDLVDTSRLAMSEPKEEGALLSFGYSKFENFSIHKQLDALQHVVDEILINPVVLPKLEYCTVFVDHFRFDTEQCYLSCANCDEYRLARDRKEVKK